MDSTSNTWFVNEANVLYLYKVTATYWKHGSTQEDGEDVTMTLHEFL